MSDFKPGTVAVATVRGVRNVRVFRTAQVHDEHVYLWQSATVVENSVGFRDDDVTDVRPLVVLDPATSPEPLNDTFAATFLDSAAEIVEKKVKRPVREVPFLRWLANEISEQTKPPRIPEPGLWGVVRDEFGNDWVCTGSTQYSSPEWLNIEEGTRLDFDDIPGPALVRDGIEDGAK